LLLRRPKSLRCWNCGAELDLEFNVTKSGDVEEEAAVRAAKATAKAARAAAKNKKAPAKKTTARKKTTKKKPAAKKTATVPPQPEPAVEG
jgi:sRNA-binding protein